MQTGGGELLFLINKMECQTTRHLKADQNNFDIIPYYDDVIRECVTYDSDVEFKLNCSAIPDSQWLTRMCECRIEGINVFIL